METHAPTSSVILCSDGDCNSPLINIQWSKKYLDSFSHLCRNVIVLVSKKPKQVPFILKKDSTVLTKWE